MFSSNSLVLLFLFCVAPLFGQFVRGVVVEQQTGRPIQGVSVCLSTSGRRVITGQDGLFVLRGVFPLTLRCSHVGFNTREIQLDAAADSLVHIALSLQTHQLANAQVTAPLRRQVLTCSYSQSVIDALSIEEKIAASLIDVLEDVPGITKRAEYHSPIVLRGLGGKRLLVTEDGNRRMGNFSGSFMGQGVNVYDLAAVEVLKGPASVRYGPGAITGIINMVSKTPFSEPGWHGKASCSYGFNNCERNGLMMLNYASLDHAFSLSGRWRGADDYVAGLGAKSLNSAYADKDLRAAYTYEGNNAVSLNAVSELHLGGPWGRPVGFNGTNYMRVYNRNDNVWHNALTLRWTPERKWNKLEMAVWFDKELRNQFKDSYDIGTGLLSYREQVSYANYYAGWRLNALRTIGAQTTLTLGTDGVFYRMQSPTSYTDFFLNTSIVNRVSKNAGIAMGGVFAETEHAAVGGKLKLRAGLRADFSQVNEGDVHDTLQSSGRTGHPLAWNGTAGIVYEVFRTIFASFQVARSCRMPDASEMFIVSSNSDGIVYGNPALQPERGLNLDAGLRGNYLGCNFDFSLYCNFLKDFISVEYRSSAGQKGLSYTYQNVDKARIVGFELSVGRRWTAFLDPDNTLNWNASCVYSLGDKLTDAPDWFSAGVPLRNIPPFNLMQELTLRRVCSSSLSMYGGVDVRCYASQYRIAPASDGGYVSPGYTIFGASAGFAYKSRNFDYDFKFRIENLADNKYRPFESLVYAMGRNVKLMCTVKF